MKRCSAKGVAALVSANHDLDDICLDGAKLLDDAAVEGLADNCPKLKTLKLINQSSKLTLDAFRYLLRKNPSICLNLPTSHKQILTVQQLIAAGAPGFPQHMGLVWTG